MKVVIKKNRRYVGLGAFHEGEIRDLPETVARQLIAQGFAEEEYSREDEKVGRRPAASARRARKHDRHVKDAIGMSDR